MGRWPNANDHEPDRSHRHRERGRTRRCLPTTWSDPVMGRISERDRARPQLQVREGQDRGLCAHRPYGGLAWFFVHTVRWRSCITGCRGRHLALRPRGGHLGHRRCPVAWGFAIMSTSSGGSVSATPVRLFRRFFYLCNQDVAHLDQSLYAEAMTLFAVVLRGPFSAHPPRPARGSFTIYFLIPNTMQRLAAISQSPLLLGHVCGAPPTRPISVVFWFTSACSPTSATLRDRSPPYAAGNGSCYGILALGWRGSARQWIALPDCVSDYGGAGDAAGRSRSTASSASTLRWGLPCPVGTPRFCLITSSPARSSRASAMVITLVIPLRYFYQARGP